MFFSDSVVGMTGRFYTTQDIQKALGQRLKDRTQASVCRELKLKPQNLSVMVRGGPISGRVLEWLGYERVEGLYRKARN